MFDTMIKSMLVPTLQPIKTPEWVGWLAISMLVTAFGLVAWWLFWSPAPGAIHEPRRSQRVLKTRRRLAWLALLSGGLASVGARWDELWHRQYGGFGEDFLWPPHLMLYAALGLNVAFAAYGLMSALRGRGGLRQRFRAEPLMGWLGLLAAYQMASIPSDLIWHEIIGPDLTAWSLPHVLLALTMTAVQLIAVPIALSTIPQHQGWRPLWRRPQVMELVTLALLAVGLLNLLQVGVTEWEWIRSPSDADPLVLARPVWAYPLVVLMLGTLSAHIVLHATRRIGAASAMTAFVLLVQIITVAIYNANVSPGPVLASHMLLLLPAIALDFWYYQQTKRSTNISVWAGSMIYIVVFTALTLPYIANAMVVPVLDGQAQVETGIVSLVFALPGGWLASRIGAWLGRLGVAPEPELPSQQVIQTPAHA